MRLQGFIGWMVLALIIACTVVDMVVGPSQLRTGLLLAAVLAAVAGFSLVVAEKGLFNYVLRRLFESALVLLMIVTITFVLLRFLPGGPFDTEKALPPEVKANIEAKYHLNEPILQQYMEYLTGLLHGDLGQSYKYLGRDVSDIVAESLPNSLQLGIYSIFLAFIVGIPLGVIAAAKHNTWIDTSMMMAAMSGVALPSFLVAPILILIFSFQLGWLPPALWDGPEYFIMPVVTLGLRPAAIIARLTRASVLDVIHADYIRTAKAKGLPYKAVLFRHVLKNSLLPVITTAGPLVAQLLSGAFVIELIYAIPGMGKHFVESVVNRDYPVVLGATIVFAAMMIIANLIVDLLYSVVDPRIKLS